MIMRILLPLDELEPDPSKREALAQYLRKHEKKVHNKTGWFMRQNKKDIAEFMVPLGFEFDKMPLDSWTKHEALDEYLGHLEFELTESLRRMGYEV